MSALFVALSDSVWVNTNDILSITQSTNDERECWVRLHGGISYTVRCSGLDFINRIEGVRT
jgi:hypothetical protein